MARIRSLHPGQWTDEDFVACSMPARLLALGLRNEADDNGVFEWKPLAIKMRLFAADAVDVAALLGELSANNQVCEFEESGKRYGVIRNFRRWQRPDKPKSWHPLPDHLRAYAGLVVDQSPRVADRSENSSAEVGCRRKEEDEGGNPESEREGQSGAVAPPPAQTEDHSADCGKPAPNGHLQGHGSASAPVATLPERPHNAAGSSQDGPGFALTTASGATSGSEPERTGDHPDEIAAVKAWNAVAERLDLPRVAKLTQARRRCLRARLADAGGLPGVRAAVERVAASAFCRGANDRGWRADFDWFVSERGFTRLMEGKFDDRAPAGSVDWDAFDREVDRRMGLAQ